MGTIGARSRGVEENKYENTEQKYKKDNKDDKDFMRFNTQLLIFVLFQQLPPALSSPREGFLPQFPRFRGY